MKLQRNNCTIDAAFNNTVWFSFEVEEESCAGNKKFYVVEWSCITGFPRGKRAQLSNAEPVKRR